MTQGGKPVRVLLVEDSDVYRDSVVFLLGREPGIEVVGAVATGGEAATPCLDKGMGGWSVGEMASKRRREPGSKGPPVTKPKPGSLPTKEQILEYVQAAQGIDLVVGHDDLVGSLEE